MIRRLLPIIAIVAISSFSFADDLSEVKAAFETFHEFQKTDDSRSPDLFTDDCSVRSIYTNGVQTKEVAFTPVQFKEWLKKGLALKQGNTDSYENVQYVQSGPNVNVNCTVLYSETGLRGPLHLTYSKDSTGTFKIKEMAATIPIPAKK